jgi:hypothetical protein
MDDEEAVEPQEMLDTIQEQPEVDSEIESDEQPNQRESVTQVPLSALQKERKKRQELELELQWERQRAQRTPELPPQEDNSRYESATREDLSKSQDEAIRIIEERMWIKNNPDKYEKINEFLPKFLKQRPNLASAINSASNRYEEAYTLMEALSPRQQTAIIKSSLPRKEAPHAPTGISKAAAMNQSVDVMSMNDAEFAQWRKDQKRRR